MRLPSAMSDSPQVFPIPFTIQAVLALDAEDAFVASPQDSTCDCGEAIPKGEAIFNTGDPDNPTCRLCGATILAGEAVRHFRWDTMGRKGNADQQEDFIADLCVGRESQGLHPCHDFLSTLVHFGVETLILSATMKGCCPEFSEVPVESAIALLEGAHSWERPDWGSWGGADAFRETTDRFTQFWLTHFPAAEA